MCTAGRVPWRKTDAVPSMEGDQKLSPGSQSFSKFMSIFKSSLDDPDSCMKGIKIFHVTICFLFSVR